MPRPLDSRRVSMPSLTGLLTLAALGWAACGKDAALCAPNTTQSCLCPGDQPDGVQTCSEDGSGYGECVCVDDVVGPRTGDGDDVGDDDDDDIDRRGGDTVNGVDVTRVFPGDTVTVTYANGTTTTVTGTTFYLANGIQVFTPTDGSVLQDATFNNST